MGPQTLWVWISVIFLYQISCSFFFVYIRLFALFSLFISEYIMICIFSQFLWNPSVFITRDSKFFRDLWSDENRASTKSAYFWGNGLMFSIIMFNKDRILFWLRTEPRTSHKTVWVNPAMLYLICTGQMLSEFVVVIRQNICRFFLRNLMLAGIIKSYL